MAQLTGTAFAVDAQGNTVGVLSIDKAPQAKLQLTGTAFSVDSGGTTVPVLGIASVNEGADNPAGAAGDFNGNVHTGCNYDPFTANARREVTDITVAGAVGSYPLTFGRVATSATPFLGQPPPNGSLPPTLGQLTDFGPAGNWLHSYQWTMDDNSTAGSAPSGYDVNFPDGGRMHFAFDADMADPYFRGGHGLGIQERLQVIFDSPTASRVYLILPDGGKVLFAGTRGVKIDRQWRFTYKVQSITDPFGLVTTLTAATDRSWIRATEPAGRWLQMNFRTITDATEGVVGDRIIDNVTASDGRVVAYHYALKVGEVLAIGNDPTPDATSLIGVRYFGDATWDAAYTYQHANVAPSGTHVRPLLSTAIDPMFTGPMWKIRYTYQDGLIPPGQNPNGTLYSAGQLKSECSLTTGEPVSTISYESLGLVETRGCDQKTRSFGYGGAHNLLILWTDWRGKVSSQTRDDNGFVNSKTDRNGRTTDCVKNFIGKTTQILFPLTPNSTPPGTPRGSVSTQFGWAACPDPNNRDADNPYYPYSSTDEGGHTTIFLRDSHKRVIQINYPDGGSEQFTYNALGQVLTHTLLTGGVETFEYDGRSLSLAYRSPDNPTGNPTVRYSYDALDRVSGVTSVLGANTADTNYTVNFTYDLRGQPLITTYPVDPHDSTRHTAVVAYSPDGSPITLTSRLGKITQITYDAYRRVRTVTGPGHNTPTVSHFFYGTTGAGEDYTQTSSFLTFGVLPTGKIVANTHDENFRITNSFTGYGTPEVEKTRFVYDDVGNQLSVIRPSRQDHYGTFHGRQVRIGPTHVLPTITFDERNRAFTYTDELGRTTSSLYDAAGRAAKVTRPNGQVLTYDSYDSMNRCLQQTVSQTTKTDAVTKATYYQSGLVHTHKTPALSGGSSAYHYEYDSSGRLTKAYLPNDTFATRQLDSTTGLLTSYTNLAGATQEFIYDNFYRPTSVAWTDVSGKKTFAYDAAGRAIQLRTLDQVSGDAVLTQIDWTYFDDGLLQTETTTTGGQPPHAVGYTYNADGQPASIAYPDSAFVFQYGYTALNQLQTIQMVGSPDPLATYTYNQDGALAARALDNGTSSSFGYDAAGQCIHVAHAFSDSSRSFDYGLNAVGNQTWVKRDNAKGDVFGYDLNDQIVSALLDHSNPDTTPAGAPTTIYDTNGNRVSRQEYGNPDATYTTNALDQYTAITRNGVTKHPTYDANGNMLSDWFNSYTYDNDNKLTSATPEGGTQIAFTYDGLGRLVAKGPRASETFFVYDGWQLIAEYAP